MGSNDADRFTSVTDKFTTVYCCDVCQTQFPTFAEAVACEEQHVRSQAATLLKCKKCQRLCQDAAALDRHEAECTAASVQKELPIAQDGAVGAQLVDLQSDNDSGNQADDDKPDKQEADEDPAPTDEEKEYRTVWTCDFCKSEKFTIFHEAVQHEQVCKHNPENQQPDTTDKSPPPKVGPNSKKVTLQRPMFLQDIYNPTSTTISPLFTTILHSLDLLYHPYSAHICFHCHYCKEQLPQSGMKWDFVKLVKVLPSMTIKHLLGDPGHTTSQGCSAVPVRVTEQLKSVNQEELSQIRNLATFLQEYFSKLSIVPRKKDERLVYGPAQESMRKHSPPNSGKKKRASEKDLEDQSPGRKKQKDVDVFPPSEKVKIGNMGATLQTTDDGNQLYLAPTAPLDGIPLVSSITSEQCKKLQSPLQLLLKQVEFFNLSSLKELPSTQKEAYPNSVGIRCQNCTSNRNGCGYSNLFSVKQLANDLVTMSTDHLIYCKCTDSLVREKLKGAAFDLASLETYCNLIVQLYRLEDTKVDDARAVVWGECPHIPSGYDGSPKNISIDFALDLDLSRDGCAKPQSSEGGISAPINLV